MLSGYVNEMVRSEFSGKVGKYWRSRSIHSQPSMTYIQCRVEWMGCWFIYYVSTVLVSCAHLPPVTA